MSQQSGRHLPPRRSLVLALFISVELASGAVHATLPHLIRYQGQVADEQGVPLEGLYALTFRLYEAETAGTNVWEETQANVSLTGGYFTVLLGQVTSLDTIDWSQPLWLSVQVSTEPELAPRQRITSVPLAIRAEVADAAKTAQTADTANTAVTAERLTAPVTTSTITDDANRLTPAGAIILWTGASCPAGYTRLVALDGRFLVGGASYNAAAGGSNTHSHGAGSYAGPSHTHVVPANSTGWGYTSYTTGFTGGQIMTNANTSERGTASTNLATDSSGTGSITATRIRHGALMPKGLNRKNTCGPPYRIQRCPFGTRDLSANR